MVFIFDMDGVLVDTNPHHRIAWRAYFDRYGKPLDDAAFVQHVSGKHNDEILKHLFGENMPGNARQLAAEKEALFRELYAPDIVPVPGLVPFLHSLKQAGIGTAVGTSAPIENLDFVMDTLNLRPFFDVLLDESKVTHPKPDPEIYLNAIAMLGSTPAEAVIFEDSLTGIRAAKATGAKVVGVATTESETVLRNAGVDWVIQDYEGVNWHSFT